MFFGANKFNKNNISKWCTPFIKTRPLDFTNSNSIINKFEPVWTECKLNNYDLYKLVNNYLK